MAAATRAPRPLERLLRSEQSRDLNVSQGSRVPLRRRGFTAVNLTSREQTESCEWSLTLNGQDPTLTNDCCVASHPTRRRVA